MEFVGDIYYYAVLKDGSWIVDQYIRNEPLFGAATEITDKTLLLVLRFQKRLHSLCLFYFFMVWPVLLCFRSTRYASIKNLLCTLVHCHCLVYSV